MREIKYRAWSFNCDCMCDVDNISFCRGEVDLSYGKPSRRYSQPHRLGGKDHSIMQYTGIKDKNGKEIYEGDIVEVGSYGKAVVEFDSGMFKYKAINGYFNIEDGLQIISFYSTIDEKLLLIGNIHEDRHLLEAENAC